MSSLVMVGRGLLPAILPCHAIQLGFAGGKARVPSKRAASESRRKAKRRRAAALQKGHLRSRPLQGPPFGSVGLRNLEYRIVRAQARVPTLLTFPWSFSWDLPKGRQGCHRRGPLRKAAERQSGVEPPHS